MFCLLSIKEVTWRVVGLSTVPFDPFLVNLDDDDDSPHDFCIKKEIF